MTRPHRWGVLGTASITPSFLRGLRGSAAGRAVAIASRDEARAATFAAAHDIPTVMTSYEALIRSPDVDSVYVPLPNSLHAEWSIRALEAGKHVLCEKPLATNEADAQRIVDAATRANRHVAEGFMYRHHPQWAALRALIDAGRLGAISTIDSWFSFALEPDELTPGSAALGGGALLDVGCYCVHLSRMLAGEPTKVVAMSRGVDVDRTMIGTMRMDRGVLARFECSIEADERRGARVSGSKGTAVVERPWLPGDEDAVIRIERDEVVVDRVVVEAADNHRLQAEAFVRAASGAPIEWPVQDAVLNARALDLLFTAARSGAVDPDDTRAGARRRG